MNNYGDLLTGTGTMLLGGVVGSTAYGLARPDSDLDRLGVFTYPTSEWFKVTEPKETLVAKEGGDATIHEVRKFLRLLLKANPTVTELLWVDETLYETVHPLGAELVGMRSAFLSADRVREAYLGYARSQLQRLNAGPGFGSRHLKHARHVLRLLDCGYGLYTTGRLQVRVDDPEKYFRFGTLPARVMIDTFVAAVNRFGSAVSPLPVHPDVDAANTFLGRVRREFS